MSRRPRRHAAGLRAAGVALALAAAAPGAAQSPPGPVREETPPVAVPANELGVKARAELRGEREEKEGRAPEQSLGFDTARLELHYGRGKWLDAVLEIDFAQTVEGGRAELLDAYVRAGRRPLEAQGGHFKPPISAIALESSWTLPVVRLGVVAKTLEEYMRFTGRRYGLQLRAAAGGPLRPELAAGAFQGVAPDGEPMTDLGLLETALACRAAIRPGPAELGAFASLMGTEPAPGYGLGRYWIAGVDASVDLALAGFGLRAWADATTGRSFYGLGIVGLDGTFRTARALAAVRWGGLEPARPYVELFGLVERVRFDVDTEGSNVDGVAVGLDAGLWRRVRLGLQVEERRSGPRSPPLSDGGNPLRDRRVYLVELGGSWDHAWRF